MNTFLIFVSLLVCGTLALAEAPVSNDLAVKNAIEAQIQTMPIKISCVEGGGPTRLPHWNYFEIGVNPATHSVAAVAFEEVEQSSVISTNVYLAQPLISSPWLQILVNGQTLTVSETGLPAQPSLSFALVVQTKVSTVKDGNLWVKKLSVNGSQWPIQQPVILQPEFSASTCTLMK